VYYAPFLRILLRLICSPNSAKNAFPSGLKIASPYIVTEKSDNTSIRSSLITPKGKFDCINGQARVSKPPYAQLSGIQIDEKLDDRPRSRGTRDIYVFFFYDQTLVTN